MDKLGFIPATLDDIDTTAEDTSSFFSLGGTTNNSNKTNLTGFNSTPVMQ